MPDSFKTLCPYCGVGCGLEVSPPATLGKQINRDEEGTPVWRVRGDRDHPSSQGMVCVKGATIAESLHKSRLTHPMMRDSLDQPFRQVSWDEALSRIVTRIQTVRFTQGADALCMYGSGQFQTEDYYIIQKLFKGCLGTNNFDTNSRLCMSSAVSGYTQSFGTDGPPCCYEDLDLTDCAFLVGTNTAECHPIVFNRLRKNHKKNLNVKLIVVDPRRTATAQVADLHLAIKPGTDIDLFNGIAHILMRDRHVDTVFLDECTQGYGNYTQIISHYPPQVVAEKCGISVSDLEKAAQYWAKSKRVLSLWSMGINQSSEGTAKVRTLINLHLMTAQIGKPGAGPFSLTGQPNAMGGREVGGLAHLLPGYRLVKNPVHRAEVEAFWKLPAGHMSPNVGLTAWEMILGLETGNVGLLWISATNPAVSMPDLERTKAALLRSPFTVYQDAYYPTETAAYAHILLPAAQWSEKTGTMTKMSAILLPIVPLTSTICSLTTHCRIATSGTSLTSIRLCRWAGDWRATSACRRGALSPSRRRRGALQRTATRSGRTMHISRLTGASSGRSDLASALRWSRFSKCSIPSTAKTISTRSARQGCSTSTASCARASAIQDSCSWL